MAESSSGTNEDKKVSRVNSFSKILRSPSRTSSKSKSAPSNPLSRLNPAKLFNRKNSGKGGSESGRGTSGSEEAEGGEMNPSTLLDAANSAVQVVKHVVNQKTAQALPQITDQVKSAAKSIESSIETNEKKFNYLDKAMDGLEKTMEDLKGKAKGGVEKVKEVLDKEIRGRSNNVTEKTPIDEVKVPNVVDQVKQEVIDAVDTVQSSTKTEETSKDIEGEIKKVEKKEDDCVNSLAKGLQKVCAPWSIKKED